MDNAFQFDESRNTIIQFNQLKKILHCFTFRVHDKKILVANIIMHIMEEIRMDRKIKMILKDRGIEEYINLDITDIDLDDCVDKDLSEFTP